jgi:hypothetical protein
MTYEGAHQLYAYLTGSTHGHAEMLSPDRGSDFTQSG